IVEDNLTSIELTAYIDANYIHGMTIKEIIDSTKAMVETGSKIEINKKTVVDVHGIGGVPGNRTTPIIVAILAAAGLTIPKTSSRAITSPSGTADTMDIFCDVALPIPKLKKILKKTGAFLAWGGAEQINLAPADDKIIKVEHPLEIDAEGQMLASIMAKKASVCATHLLLEMSVGKHAKLKTKKQARAIGKKFRILGNELGIKIAFYIADGSQPIGNGIGPALEAKDVLLVLLNDPTAPKDLKTKSLKMAAMLLEFTNRAKKRQGLKIAKKILESGNAYSKFMEIIKAQGGREITPNQIPLGKFTRSFKATRTGTITEIDNKITTKICRLAGAPDDHGSGLYFYKKKGDRVNIGDKLFTIYSQNEEELGYAVEAAKQFRLMRIN
ncbi:MAG: thymidine phosphorylase, partial [Candidatus Woesearchaeota archaeon]